MKIFVAIFAVTLVQSGYAAPSFKHPLVTDVSDKKFATQGSSVNLTCSVLNYSPETELAWQRTDKNGITTQVARNSDIFIDEADDTTYKNLEKFKVIPHVGYEEHYDDTYNNYHYLYTLEIRNIEESDEGVYECEAKRNGQKSTLNTGLVVSNSAYYYKLNENLMENGKSFVEIMKMLFSNTQEVN